MSESDFDDTQAYFAAIAESYDRLQPVVAGPGYQAGLDFVLKLVPHDEGEAFTAVELGCGTASLTAAILDRFPNARAVAVDSEPAMLEVARRKLARFGQRVEIRDDEATSCKLPACDLVLSAFMFHHIAPEHVAGTMQRIVGALASGGCLILLDTMQAGPRWSQRVGAQSRRLYEDHVAAAIAGDRATQEEIDARWAFKRRMKAAGKDVEYRHCAEDILRAMQVSGFSEAGLVWRLFAHTLLMAFVGQ